MSADEPSIEFRNRRVLVTGASGFIGSHAVRGLLALGADVHALVRRGTVARRLDALSDDRSVTRWPGDVTDARAVHACVRGASPHVVLHLAGDTSGRRAAGAWDAVERSVAVHLSGTLNVLRAAAESGGPVETVVRLGGLEEYGTAPIPFTEDARERPISPYSASQVATTHYCQALQPQLPFAVVTLRPALVYGPDQDEEFFIPALIAACVRGETFAMTHGTQRRDLLYIDDMIDALFRAATRPGLAGAVINVGTGEEHAIRDVADAIVRLTGYGRLALDARQTRARDLDHLVTTTERAYVLLGWRARTSLPDGLARTVAWSRAQPPAVVPC